MCLNERLYPLSEVLKGDPAPRIHVYVGCFLKEWWLLAVRVEVHLITSANFLQASLRQTQETRFVKLDAADYCQRFWEHMLPLILVVHVHTGKEHVVLRMSMDPSKENNILSIMHIPHIFIISFPDLKYLLMGM